MVLGVAIGSLVAAIVGMYLATSKGHSLLAVPANMWPPLIADCLGIGLYGILSALATGYLPGAEVAFLLLLDVIIAPLLVCVVYGEWPSAAGGSGAVLLAAAVIGHEFAALRDRSRNGSGAAPPPPWVGGGSRKARVSDIHLTAGDDEHSCGGSEGETPTEIEMEIEMEDVGAISETAGLLGSHRSPPRRPQSGDPETPATGSKRVSWAS